jgi:hypothetical protein
MAQLGNAQWPPHDGDIIDLAVTVVDEATATNLLGAQVATHPQLVGIRRDIASNLVVKLKQ